MDKDWRSVLNMKTSHWHEFLKQFIAPGSLVFDIGAHAGAYTRNYLLMGARVVAVEPQAKIIERLIDAILVDERIDFSMLTPICAACGERRGVETMSIYNRSTLASLAPEKWAQSRMRTHGVSGTAQVNVITLDSLIDAYGVPDFMKVDVEYYEPEVFKGLSKPVPALCYEYTREYFTDAKFVAKHLQTFGDYEFAYGIGREAPMVAWTKNTNAMFKELSAIDDVALWGDIYARIAKNGN